ncbi:DUF4932 domain-containing protein [Flavobacterium kingsejongi]|uniref:DUF4932 domain-containing protein n=1 Tax=Flavobacterium kingsejongi TaxID=1678728 RepID=A0A2S1LKL1_9FLAO|nr:DUF4932 domain-containing protein [Flavobacterium kingsejongi]AWG24267.1 hypothetical protein FK004_03015 [Flavobacterium kingsejongi]
MKLMIALLMVFASAAGVAKGNVISTVDQRVELLSIVFRLAGNPEYNMKLDKNYVKDIEDYFGAYRSHTVVSFAKKLHTEKGMGFSKVMFLAVALELKNNKFSIIKQSGNTLKGKWDEKDAIQFVALLNDFYKVAAFEKFFKDHETNYKDATSLFDHSVATFDQKWYLDYYGDHEVDYRVVIGFGNGGANYGPSVKPVGQKKLVYAIMGSWTFDEQGKPFFPEAVYLPYLIHEFNHSFIDHILEEDTTIEQQLKSSGEALLEAQKMAMKLEGYEDWHSLIDESLVRASVVRYLMDHGATATVVQQEITTQTQKGFVWIKDLVSLLGAYETSRDTYPTFKSFYPRIIAFFDAKAGEQK